MRNSSLKPRPAAGRKGHKGWVALREVFGVWWKISYETCGLRIEDCRRTWQSAPANMTGFLPESGHKVQGAVCGMRFADSPMSGFHSCLAFVSR